MEKFRFPARLSIARQWMPAALLLLAAVGISAGVCGVAMETSPGQGSAAAGLSQAAANAFQAKMMELSVAGPVKESSLKPVVITDAEVNSFLKYDPPEFLPPSVKDIELHFNPQGIQGAANVNFDQLHPTEQLGDQLGARLLASIFKGTQRVTALGALATGDGTGTVTIKDVHIGSTALSDWLVNLLIQTYIQSAYKIDLSKPFLLPNHVTHIEFARGKAIFVRGIKRDK